MPDRRENRAFLVGCPAHACLSSRFSLTLRPAHWRGKRGKNLPVKSRCVPPRQCLLGVRRHGPHGVCSEIVLHVPVAFSLCILIFCLSRLFSFPVGLFFLSKQQSPRTPLPSHQGTGAVAHTFLREALWKLVWVGGRLLLSR